MIESYSSQLREIDVRIEQAARLSPCLNRIYFKTGVGDYAEHDAFLGIRTPALRLIANDFHALPLPALETLLSSPFNEKRLLALYILIYQYKKNLIDKGVAYEFYLAHSMHVNNWNLVDASAHWIVGAHLMDRNKEPLLILAQSDIVWERRIAIIATWYFIKHDNHEWTQKLAELLRHDTHDLIHKAVGWMLREMGKRNKALLIAFLDNHADGLPRTMLRYAIEKFPLDERKKWMGRAVGEICSIENDGNASKTGC